MSDTNDPGLDRRNLLMAGATLAAASTLGAAAPSVALAQNSSLNPQPLPPSPEWTRALPTGPDMRVKMTEEYARHIARDAYFWAWPLVNIFNRRQAFKDVKEVVMAGPCRRRRSTSSPCSPTTSRPTSGSSHAPIRTSSTVRDHWRSI